MPACIGQFDPLLSLLYNRIHTVSQSVYCCKCSMCSKPTMYTIITCAFLCLQLPALLADPNAEFKPSNFFAEQLTAFELWLEHGSADKKPPEQLPIVLQVR